MGRGVKSPLAGYWGRSVDDGSGIRIPELQPATERQNKGHFLGIREGLQFPLIQLLSQKG